MRKEIVYCNECCKQMTTDVQNSPINHGYELVGKFSISENLKTNCGSSHRRLVDISDADICSVECLRTRLVSLVNLLGADHE